MGRLKKRQPQKAPDLSRWSPSITFGRYKADNVRLVEAAINNLVLRVPVIAYHKLNNIKREQKQFSRRTRHGRTRSGRNPRARYSLRRPVQTRPFKSTVRRLQLKNGVKKEHRRGQKRETFYRKRQLNGVVGDKRPLSSQPVSSELTFDFANLAELVCVMKLPSPTWKVTVTMNHDLSTVYTFAKSHPPKCVTFPQNNFNYSIVMEGVPVVLLGCPASIDSLCDLEILLEIVNRLDLRDCMVCSR
jgi:hypothetical protein